jgi:CubicO group peptidase (beta-lactamase class C family)
MMRNWVARISLKRSLRIATSLSCLWMWCAVVHAMPANETAKIDELMSTMYQRGQFNGAILVAVHGNIVYRKGFGKSNVQTGADFTPETPSDVGSVTKQFTAMAIMMLAERGKLSYDDPVSKYIPEFSRSEHLSKITLRQLLNHTSGIPDYDDLRIDDAGLDQQGLIGALVKKEDLLTKPGMKYRYSNPGYALLAVVVERVSGERFGEFLGQEIFERVGMNNTFVYDSPTKKNTRTAVGYGQFGQVDDGGPTAIPGDGGIYSTVDDLLKWDQALYTDRLVDQSTLAAAFAPGKVLLGTSTYGFGWNIGVDGGSKYLWHQGNHAGFRAFIGRRLADRVTVIMLTNRGNSNRRDINAAVQNILADKPYVLPKQSGAESLYKTIRESGIQAALQQYDTLKHTKNDDYDVGESELNTLGYQLLYGDHRVSDAIAIFKLNAREHPWSSNAFDSLGEAYARSGERDLAIKSYAMAVTFDPANEHAAGALKKLGLGRALWLALPAVSAIGVLLIAVILLGRRRTKPQIGQLPKA